MARRTLVMINTTDTQTEPKSEIAPIASPRQTRHRTLAIAAAMVVLIASACAPGPPPIGQRGPLGSAHLNLTQQHVFLYDPQGVLVARVPVSSGASGRTPTGTFRVTRKSRVGTSSGNHSVHMDYFTRFNGGIGFHGIPWKYDRSRRINTPLGLRPVSAGCVRMNDDIAQWIYEALPVGAPVYVYYQ